MSRKRETTIILPVGPVEKKEVAESALHHKKVFKNVAFGPPDKVIDVKKQFVRTYQNIYVFIYGVSLSHWRRR